MTDCTIRWRPSGGRGEYEFTPSSALADRHVVVRIPAFGIDVPAEVWGRIRNGKPRLRKRDGNDRHKLHLPNLILALAKLPEPAREDKGSGHIWPLEGKGYIASSIDCTIVEDDGENATLVPTRLSILHTDHTIDLNERFDTIKEEIQSSGSSHPKLRTALDRFDSELKKSQNSSSLRDAADNLIALQSDIFGTSNAGSTKVLEDVENLPAVDIEEVVEGKEGKLLTRWHSYRERDRNLVKKAKALFKAKNGNLYCEVCNLDPVERYGERGEGRIHAHHRTPVEELMPGSVTKAEDLAMVCPTCHDIIHAKRPWISVEDLKEILAKNTLGK